MGRKLVLGSFLFCSLTYTPTFSQEDFISKISDQVDAVTAARTQELMNAGISKGIAAFQLAYQGIDPKGLEKLKALGLDVKNIAERWDSRTVEEASIFADCIVIGKVLDLRLVPGGKLNKYVYVKVERWLKGKILRGDTVVLRTSGSGPGKLPGSYMWESHETRFKQGERLLLLLSRASFLLSAQDMAPLDEENFKEDYVIMYRESLPGKLLIHGDQVINVVNSRNTSSEKIERVVNQIINIRQEMELAKQ